MWHWHITRDDVLPINSLFCNVTLWFVGRRFSAHINESVGAAARPYCTHAEAAAASITISLSNQNENECKRNLSAASKPDTENTTLHTKKQKRFIETSSGDPFVGAAPRGGAHLLAAVRAKRPSHSLGLTLSGPQWPPAIRPADVARLFYDLFKMGWTRI